MPDSKVFFRDWIPSEWDDWNRLSDDGLRRRFILRNGCDPSLSEECTLLFSPPKQPRKKTVPNWTKRGALFALLGVFVTISIYLLSEYA